MRYIPKDARWYLADIVLEIKIEDDARNVIHINTVLVRANSPERAYLRAIKLGQEAEHKYENTEEKEVQVTFHGLRDLSVIHDKLRHGAELIYEERSELTTEQIAKIVSPKDELSVFEARRKPSEASPNYMPKSVMEMVEGIGFNDKDIFSNEPL